MKDIDLKVAVHEGPTQTQGVAHLRSMHRRGLEPLDQLKCASAASYSLKEDKQA